MVPAIKPYCSRSPQLTSAVKRLCAALAMLIRLCDEITAMSLRADAAKEELDTSAPALSPEHVSSVVKGVTAAVEEVSVLAQQHMTRPALSPRPALVSPRASTQRNSLPGKFLSYFWNISTLQLLFSIHTYTHLYPKE